jgi:7-cyano-7-deazaguanine synthase in queuosine biosynthesis
VFRAVKAHLEYILFFLSSDTWRLRFAQSGGQAEGGTKWPAASGSVLLFSGGLDSFAGALHLAERGTPLILVSHVTANHDTSKAQTALARVVRRRLRATEHLQIRVGCRDASGKGFAFPHDANREDTQRTRSFVFVVLAALAARRRGFREIVMLAENGQMAVNLPLTTARVGGFSTHTAHPEFMVRMSDVLTETLGFDIALQNPFLYETKAEVVARIRPDLRKPILASVSCWRARRGRTVPLHCGECVPCLIRRIALEYNGLSEAYERDLLAEDLAQPAIDDTGKRNLLELAQFVASVRGSTTQASLEDSHPELINESFDAAKAGGMYRRFSAEATTVFGRYPQIAGILG